MTRVAFIGGGNMAFAFVNGLRASDSGFDIVVADPIAAQRARFVGVATETNNAAAAADADVVVLAVKPQALAAAVREAAPSPEQLLLSIAAGVPMRAIAAKTSPTQPVVRCMPNTPALLRAGISGAVANAATDAAQRELAQRVLAAVGDVVWFEDERQLDAVTALSGTGPAYFFLLLESMVDAGVALGLEKTTAERLAIATAAGAARMAGESEATPEMLRERVTSPGGTTERALSILQAHGATAAFRAAIIGACERSRELGREFRQGRVEERDFQE